MTIIRGRDRTRPTPDPLKSSVLDHATVVTIEQGIGMVNETGMWPSYNCMDTLIPTELCPDPTVDKTFDTVPWEPAFSFAVYGGVQCSAVGLDQADQAAEVKRVFERNEGKGVERALLENRFVARVLDNTRLLPNRTSWDAPVDLTPATAISPLQALAVLEGHAARVYAGRPTIHMPVAAATVLEGSGLIVWEGDLAYTKNGSKVAMGGGYDPDYADVAFAGALDMFATGEVYAEKSGVVDQNVHVLPGDGSSHDDNQVLSLVERIFRVGVDCFVAKATGTLWS